MRVRVAGDGADGGDATAKALDAKRQDLLDALDDVACRYGTSPVMAWPG